MAALGNVIWFVFGGAILALFWLIIAGIFAITIIDLFNNTLKKPVIIYNTTNQGHS
jgi:uncharacterized membrane protein YccF (DUF307 family)